MEIKKPVTIDDMYHLPKDGQKYELVDGDVLVSPAGVLHGEIALKIAHIIATFLDDHPIGKLYGENVGLIFPTGNLRSPDAFFVRTEKLPGGAVEVLSPADSTRQVLNKIGEFLECGVPLVWVADPGTRTVTAYQSLSNVQRFTAKDTISAEPVLPGFTCLVSGFFN